MSATGPGGPFPLNQRSRPPRNALSRLPGFVATATLFALIWAAWNEAFTPGILFQGIIVGSITLFVTNRFLIKASYQHTYRIGVMTLLHYMVVLFVEIFRSGYHAIYITVTDKINVGVVDLPTEITDPLIGTMVASAITLTPGTVTIEFEPGHYKVVWIDCTTTDPEEAAKRIFGSFERVFVRSGEAT